MNKFSSSIVFFVFCLVFFIYNPFVFSQDLSTRKANCDVCGYCEGAKVPSNWEKCRKCLYPKTTNTLSSPGGIPTPDPYHYYTDFGCLSTRPGEFAAQISSFFFSVVGGIAFLYFIYGAFVIATSQSSPDRINYGKRIVFGSIAGLLFALCSVLIIRLVSSTLGMSDIK